MDAAWSALHATGHGHDTFLIGETAPRGLTTGNNPGNFSGMVPLRFIRALYCVGSNLKPLRGQAARSAAARRRRSASKQFAAQNPGLFHATGFADHPYPQGRCAQRQDDARRAGLCRPRRRSTICEHTLDTVQQGLRLEHQVPDLLDRVRAPDQPAETISRAIDSKTAAKYLNWSEYISWLDPRVSSYDQYLLTDPPGGNFATGLAYADGKPKPQLYDAYRLPCTCPSRAPKGPVARGLGRRAARSVRPQGHG